MNQLISGCDGYVIVGLKDTAFLVNCQVNSICELKKNDMATSVPTPTPTPKEETVSINENNEKKVAEKNDDTKKQKSEEELNMIHAVTMYRSKQSVLFCAVARGNKSLAIYQVDTRDSLPTEIIPYMVYDTAKRLSCMRFASWPVEGESTITASTSTLLLAGDMAGDANAFSLDDQQPRQRLLLGHTASMLTRLCMSNKYLLTADRDEKIRISSFPQTYVIEGFLLGHEAYITAIDATTSGLVATSSGDCSIRLWSLETKSQIFELSVPKDATTEQQESESVSSNDLIPVDLRFNADGTLMAVIFDQSNRIDLYRVSTSGSTEYQLELIHTAYCSSQPLGICSQGNDCYYIVQKNPDFLARYQVKDGLFIEDSSTEAIQELRKMADGRKIVMQDTILERDQYGNVKLRKLHETRGPAAGDEPWNRSERVEKAKAANKRHKRRRLGKQE